MLWRDAVVQTPITAAGSLALVGLALLLVSSEIGTWSATDWTFLSTNLSELSPSWPELCRYQEGKAMTRSLRNWVDCLTS